MPMAALATTSTSSGHGCFPPQTATVGSTDVFINGSLVHRVGDSWTVHCCKNKGCHSGTLITGSSSVFVNGISAGRVGDLIGCGPGNIVMTGSTNVFIGG